MKILIIEDDMDTLGYLKGRLEEKCYIVDSAGDGKTGVRLAKANDYDMILLDYGLPEKNGFSVCEEIRTQPNMSRRSTPIIMISVTDDVPHIIEGLNGGVDDYLAKPFFFDELYARMNAVLRRPTLSSKTTFALDDLVLDSTSQQVTRGSTAIYLTKKEFGLLEYLLRNKGAVVSRGAITEHVWDMNVDSSSNTIEMHVLNLRKKIDTPRKRKLIHNVPGRGYKIDVQR
jgi:two-component system OmpR family response regulator